ncbi:MAG: arylesterase [Myxococcales bacterium]|nr:MAG: arylesterase [Myxococcales bacterium]
MMPAFGACGGGASGPAALELSDLADDAPTVLFFGDSIVAGYGLPREEAFPSLLQHALLRDGFPYRCVNGGLSGDTTTAAIGRIATFLAVPPAVVFVELGANDMLRGFDRSTTFENLVVIVERFQEVGARVILADVHFSLAHPAYERSMRRLYEEVAERTGARSIPDLLVGVSGVVDRNQPDGVHPNARGHSALAATALPPLEAALRSLEQPAP